jgi:methionyl aminopeptidase
MLYLKTDEEVGFLRESNLLVSRTLAEIAALIEPGVTTQYLDAVAETFPQHSVHLSTTKWCMVSQQGIYSAKAI